jgi:hypothetical protein
MDFVSFTDGKRRGCNGRLEGGFLGGVPILNLTVVQHAPFASLRNNLVLGQSHKCLPPLMRVCFVPLLKVNFRAIVSLFLLRVAFPRLVSLPVRTLVRPLARIVFWGLFAHVVNLRFL